MILFTGEGLVARKSDFPHVPVSLGLRLILKSCFHGQTAMLKPEKKTLKWETVSWNIVAHTPSS